MTTISTLVQSFSAGCEDDLNTTVGKELGTAKQALFQDFLVKKKYNQKHKDENGNLPTDLDRYCALMEAIVDNLCNTGTCNDYLTNPDAYFNKMKALLCSEEAYDLFVSDFTKGSYKGISQQLNRIFNPKKDDRIDGMEALLAYTKQYEVDFPTKLETAEGIYMYSRTDTGHDDDERSAHVAGISFPLFASGMNILSFYEDTVSGEYLSFWITDKELGENFMEVTREEILLTLSKSSFSINPVHFTNLDSIKRNFMGKNFDLFNSNAHVMKMAGDAHFYSGVYKRGSDMNDASETTISNAVMGLAQAFSELSKVAFAVFVFDGEIGNINVNSYWLTIGPKEDIMSQDDQDVFDWDDLSIGEFVRKVQENGTVGTSCLH